MEDVLEIQDQTQAPLQEDPPRKKLYKGLVKDKLYSKSYDEFNKQYSTPEAIDRLHKGLVEEKLYSKSINDFNKQYFSDLTPTSKKKVGTIGFEESSLQAGNVLSQSDGVVGEEIPQIEMYTLPNGEMVETDPVSISRKYKELKDRKKTVTEGVGSSFGMGTGTTKEVEDEESQKAAKKLSGDFLGIDIEGIYEDTQGLSDDLVRVYNNDILPDREWNNQLYQRKLANIKWRSSFEKKLLEDVDKGNIDPDNYNRIKHGIEQLPISTGQGDYSNQRAAVKSLAADIREYGGENRDKLLKDFAVEVSKVYGNPDNKAEEKFKDSPESKYLNTDAQLGYQYLQDVSPDKAEQYKRLFIDPKSLKDNPDELRGYNHLMQTLEETGINLKQNAVTEELNSLNKQAKINGGLTPEQIERATKLEKVNEELSAKRNELDSKYPDRIGDKIDDAVQEVMGQRTAGFDYAGGKVFTAFRNTAQGVWEAASSPFMSDESNTLRELAIMGQSLEDEKIYHKTDRNKALQYDTMVIQPELQKEVDLIKNNNLLTDDQKGQKLYKLFRENTDKFGRVPIKGGKFNISPSSIMYGMTDLGTSLLPFVAIEAATGGIGGAGAGAKFLRTFTAAASSTFHDEYAAALMEGKSQSEAYRSAMASTAINSLAMAGAGTPTEIRAMASTKTSAGKLIQSMSDDSIESVLKKGTPKGLKSVAQNVKERLKATPEMLKQGVKTGAKFEAYMGAANAINGREQDFKRSLLAIGEFGILGAALGQAAFKTPTQLQKSAGLEFGKKPDEYIAIAESMKKDGLLTDAQLEQRTELIKSYGEAYKSLPKNLDEKQQREYLYETVIKNEATKGKSNLPPKQAAEAEHQAMVADYKREIILDQPTENGLESRKSSLEKKLEKKDEEGKLVLDEKEAAKVKAEIEAIDTHLDTTKKEVKEEELPNLSQPIEGVNEKGIPIGENVPPETGVIDMSLTQKAPSRGIKFGEPMFDLNNPLAEKEINGSNYAITDENLINNGDKVYRLYKDRKLIGEYFNIEDAQKAASEISKSKGQPEQITQPIELSVEPKVETTKTEEVVKLESERDAEISKIKPDLKLELVSANDLVNSKDPVGNKERHNELKERYKKLRQLIDCL